MKLIPFLFKTTEPTLSSSSSSWPWPWPYCRNPKTLSFRDETIRKSDYIAAESSFNKSSICDLSTDNEVSLNQTIENVIRGARSSTERLFFDDHLGEATSCLLGDEHELPKTTKNNTSSDIINKNDCATSNDTKVVLMEMDSSDPFADFKKSMEEIVEASGGFNVKDDWGSLDQLLSWYLNFNCKSNHGYIIGAFIDLLVSLDISSSSNSSSYSSPTSSSCENRNTSSDSSSTTVIT